MLIVIYGPPLRLTVIRGLPLRFKINELYQCKYPKTFAQLLNYPITST